MIKKEGKTWYWCPKHVSQGKYDGLYVTHKPEDHDEWAKNRNRFRKRDNKNENDREETANASTNNENNKALAAQADALIKEARDEVDF